MSLTSLLVHPVVSLNDRRGYGWSRYVDISTGEIDVPPFMRLELSQPAYSVPPPLRIVPEESRIAALGQAFAAILLERTQRPAFSRPPLSRCRVGGFQEMEVHSRPR